MSAVGVSATVTIDAPGATVVLRGLLVKGSGAPGVHGIFVEDAAAVHNTGCEVEGFAGAGIAVSPASAEIFVSGTVVRNSGRGFLGGGRTTVENSRFENNVDDGIQISVNAARAAITGVAASGNGTNGSFVAGNNVTVTIEASLASNNGDAGLRVSTGVVSVSNSAFTGSSGGFGLQRTGGTLYSRGNNTVHSNAVDVSGTITPLAGK